MFIGAHVLLATRTGNPEWALDPAEVNDFFLKCKNVARHYSVDTTQKAIDWAALFGSASMMYIPRIAAIQMRKRFAQPERRPPPGPPPEGSNVTQFPGAGLDILPDIFSDVDAAE